MCIITLAFKSYRISVGSECTAFIFIIIVLGQNFIYVWDKIAPEIAPRSDYRFYTKAH